ncbi:hypothetical protein WK80_18460 [Burkholderia multivorans]|nr:hypothetical protein WK80_18460 [Burkholderia multivorans]KWA39698.1 hypothetical protein WL27_15135 [Burkholderia multivorans]
MGCAFTDREAFASPVGTSFKLAWVSVLSGVGISLTTLARHDLQEGFVFIVQFLRPITASVNEVFQVRPRQHRAMHRSVFHFPNRSELYLKIMR